jgi:hypothetical protein
MCFSFSSWDATDKKRIRKTTTPKGKEEEDNGKVKEMLLMVHLVLGLYFWCTIMKL